VTAPEAKALIAERIGEGQALLDRPVPGMAELGALDAEEERWHTRNVMLLRRYLPGPDLVTAYVAPLPLGRPVYRPDSVDAYALATGLAYRHAVLGHRLDRLRGINAALEQPAPAAEGPAADLAFPFVRDADRRALAEADYAEAARAFQVGAWKAAAIMGAGVLEVLLLDALARTEIRARPGSAADSGPDPDPGAAADGGPATLDDLAAAACALRLVGSGVGDLVRAAGDPRSARVAHGPSGVGQRPRQHEAGLLLQAVETARGDLLASLPA
jgi:hypothetical protein